MVRSQSFCYCGKTAENPHNNAFDATDYRASRLMLSRYSSGSTSSPSLRKESPDQSDFFTLQRARIEPHKAMFPARSYASAPVRYSPFEFCPANLTSIRTKRLRQRVALLDSLFLTHGLLLGGHLVPRLSCSNYSNTDRTAARPRGHRPRIGCHPRTVP